MARIKVKEGEDLSDSNIERVLELFEAGKLNKTQACKELSISYNTKRLDSIFAEYKSKVANEKRLFKENSRKPFSDADIAYIATSMLSGSSSVSEIAKDLYRSPAAVKRVIEEVGIPTKDTDSTYQNPAFLPEACISDKFYEGQVVWTSQYQCLGIVRRVAKNDCYSIYVLEPIDWDKVDKLYVRVPRTAKWGGFYATLSACELGSLEHLKIDIYSNIQKDFPTWKIERPKIDS